MKKFKELDRFQIMRQERIQMFEDTLKEMKEVDLRYFLAYMSVNYGIRRKIGMEYLEDLEAVGRIKIEDGRIYYIGNTRHKKKNQFK